MADARRKAAEALANVNNGTGLNDTRKNKSRSDSSMAVVAAQHCSTGATIFEGKLIYQETLVVEQGGSGTGFFGGWHVEHRQNNTSAS